MCKLDNLRNHEQSYNEQHGHACQYNTIDTFQPDPCSRRFDHRRNDVFESQSAVVSLQTDDSGAGGTCNCVELNCDHFQWVDFKTRYYYLYIHIISLLLKRENRKGSPYLDKFVSVLQISTQVN